MRYLKQLGLVGCVHSTGRDRRAVASVRLVTPRDLPRDISRDTCYYLFIQLPILMGDEWHGDLPGVTIVTRW